MSSKVNNKIPYTRVNSNGTSLHRQRLKWQSSVTVCSNLLRHFGSGRRKTGSRIETRARTHISIARCLPIRPWFSETSKTNSRYNWGKFLPFKLAWYLCCFVFFFLLQQELFIFNKHPRLIRCKRWPVNSRGRYDTFVETMGISERL